MAKQLIKTSDYRKVLLHGLKVNPTAFYVGVDSRGVTTGGSLTAHICDGGVVVASNRYSEEQLYELFSTSMPFLRLIGTETVIAPLGVQYGITLRGHTERKQQSLL